MQSNQNSSALLHSQKVLNLTITLSLTLTLTLSLTLTLTLNKLKTPDSQCNAVQK